jgi:hypothetical protein
MSAMKKGRKKGYSRLRNELKRTSVKATKEYLWCIRDETGIAKNITF